MSAPWLDLSAHNLALWRVGPDQAGLRLYVLRPIFSDMPHEIADLRTSAGQTFVWDASERAYTLRLRPGQEKLPAPVAWLQAYPGALQRDRSQCTFNTHQPSMLDLATLALANPWAWSNIAHPDRCFANEEQALADGEPRAVLRDAIEVDPRMVRPLHAIATLDADTLPQEQDAPEGDAPSAEPAPNAEAAADQADAGESAPSPDPREDYGDRIAGARKHAFDTWLSNLRAQQAASQEGAATVDTLKQMASETRKDTLIGAKQQMADSLKDSPILAALWAAVNREIPASVASTPFKKWRHRTIDTKVAMRRVVGYAEVVSAIGRRFAALRQNLTDDMLTQAIFGDAMEAMPKDWRWQRIVPKDPYDQEHPLLSDEVASDETGVGVLPLREALDRTAYSLAFLVSEVSGESVSKIRRKLMLSVLRAGFAIEQKKGDPNDLSTDFHMEAEAIARMCSNMKYLDMGMRGLDSRSWVSFVMSDEYFKQRGIDESATKNMSKDEQQALMRDYFRYRADRVAEELLAGLKKVSYTASYSDMEPALETTYVQPADEKKLDEDPLYREFKDTEKRFLTTLTGAVLRHHSRTADAAPSADIAEQPDTITPENPSDAEPGEAEKVEPDFLKWDSDNLLPLPNEPNGNSYRNGAATERGDKDITEKELCDRFGFRGVQYGNWMTQKDRQEHLNAAFDSCCDLQDLMGFEEAAMVGLPRKRAGADRQWLAIALGARGRGGRAAAHYEPDLHVINLTKTSGAGSLLHEWTHAADGYMGAERTGGQNILESNLARKTWSETPFAMFAKALSDKTDTTTNASRAATRMAVVRSAHPVMRKIVRETFLGLRAQRLLFQDLRQDFYMRWQAQSGDAADATAREIARKDATNQAIALFESNLPSMVRWVDSRLDILEKAIQQDEQTQQPLSLPSSALNKALIEHFLNPFFVISNRKARFTGASAENTLREAFALEPLQKDAPRTQVDGEAMVARRWANACRIDLWKQLSGPVSNNTTVYQKAISKHSSESSKFFVEAKSLGEYWARPHELVARAVSAIGYDGLEARGVKNTYLTTSAPSRYSDPKAYRGDPEPQGYERAAFAEIFIEECLPPLRDSLQEAVSQARAAQNDDQRNTLDMAIAT
jgi:hypothetical protein